MAQPARLFQNPTVSTVRLINVRFVVKVEAADRLDPGNPPGDRFDLVVTTSEGNQYGFSQTFLSAAERDAALQVWRDRVNDAP
jgi:hypothetical protein